jgi:hypothetical protein
MIARVQWSNMRLIRLTLERICPISSNKYKSVKEHGFKMWRDKESQWLPPVILSTISAWPVAKVDIYARSK